MPEDLLSPNMMMPLAQAARVIGISYNAAHRMLKRGVFPVEAVRVGSRWMVRRADVERLVVHKEEASDH